MSVPVFLASELADAGSEMVLGGAEGRHAATVRRLRPGERVDITDGAGEVAECAVVAAEKGTLRLEVLRRYRVPATRPRLVVVQGLPKGDRGELAVEMMTEVGVDVIVPWAAARCVTRWKGERAAKALARWRSTAREAGKQARRFHLPEITEQATTDEVAALLGGAACGIVLHEEAKTPLSGVELPDEGDIVLVVGPEGGVAGDELDRFREAGAVPALLGPTVLRTSTAGVAAAAVVLARTGRW
ncbi:16S rRNA (uracil(1498)-N(3))-methyltransferase [Thermostaphylospora chromogena]|uniref:Ribosomal RNA small subunit methyltransferase E n=1 Tax=Thermostaphylospora chromogena TaxID=35622 RepID=A0A1H1FNF2_9ACTN|nr:16S rRNA (uracil(1498)-N(3))-methyltransferase [Thermostaphylospora chromogena]SDR02593.1 16S rRNA (uracil1498-N3)-methyltransferase [Thermostaphylospora chromogena]